MDDLGLQDEIVPVSYSHVASKNRYLYVNKKLHKMPSGIRLDGQAAGFSGEDLLKAPSCDRICSHKCWDSCLLMNFNDAGRVGSFCQNHMDGQVLMCVCLSLSRSLSQSHSLAPLSQYSTGFLLSSLFVINQYEVTGQLDHYVTMLGSTELTPVPILLVI